MTLTWTVLGLNLASVSLLMLIGWLVSLRPSNVTIVDSFWGLGFVLIAWLTLAFTDGYTPRQWLVAGLVTVWGVRLSLHLTRRNHGKGEDPRYARWRRQSGPGFWWTSLFKVFLLQAVFLWLIALALQAGIAAATPARLTWLDVWGALVWLAGFYFESVADRQLRQFKADPANRGRVLSHGLWAYCRHPNYFGEAVLWWGLFLPALATGAWWAVLSPLLITAVLLKMTGVPLTERLLLEKRPGYREYMATTNAFIPRFTKKGAHHETAHRLG